MLRDFTKCWRRFYQRSMRRKLQRTSRGCRRWWHSRPVRKWRKWIHNGILKIISAAAVIAYFGAVSGIESLESGCSITSCLITCVISGAWLLLFCIANNWFEEEEG